MLKPRQRRLEARGVSSGRRLLLGMREWLTLMRAISRSRTRLSPTAGAISIFGKLV
jgi:hypothetical protein